MSYILKYIVTKEELQKELQSFPENIKYYAKYDTFIGDSNAVKYIESKLHEYYLQTV
jgi:hypothetical protein